AAHASCFTIALSFALAQAGHTQGTLETSARVTLDKDGDGFKISKSALTLKGHVDGIDQSEFERIANEAKAGCPVSKVLNADITLETTFG
ncbi:OsmC family peroxiredoxin, partial [Streptococcus suis]